MYLQPIPLRALKPWLVTFTLVGLIDLFLISSKSDGLLSSDLLSRLVMAGLTIHGLWFDVFYDRVTSLFLMVYFDPWAMLIDRMGRVYWGFSARRWDKDLLYNVLSVINSLISVGLVVALLRRLFRPVSAEQTPIRLEWPVRAALIAAAVMLVAAFWVRSGLRPTQWLTVPIAVGLAVLVLGLGLSWASRRMWGNESPVSIFNKPAWIVPYFMTYAVIGLLVLGLDAIIITAERNDRGLSISDIVNFRAAAFAVGLFFGALGTIWGLRFNRASGAHVQSVFAASTLPDNDPLRERTHALAARLGLPPPAVGVIAATNAFAIGPSPQRAAVVLGKPLLESFTHDELNAVIGHELGHVVTADMQRLQMATGFESMFEGFVTASRQMTAQMGQQTRSSEGKMGVFLTLLGLGLVRWFVLIFARIGVRAFSRAREYRADAIGAALTSPEAMISALRKVHGITAPATEAEDRYGYMMFRPVPGRLFATHPPVESRIRALEKGTYRINLPDLVPQRAGDPFEQATHYGFVGTAAPASGFAETAPHSPTGFRPSPAIVVALAGPSRRLWWGLIGGGALVAGAAALTGLLIVRQQNELTRLQEVAASVSPRDAALRQREAAVNLRDQSVSRREQDLTTRDRRLTDFAGSLQTSETALRQREEEFARLRANPGPELARLSQLQDQLRAERQTLDQQQRELTAAQAGLNEQRGSLEDLRRQAQRATETAATERQRLEADRRNAGPEISRLESLRQQVARDQAELASQRQNLANDLSTLRDQRARASSEQADLSRRENELAQRREQIVREWNTVVDSAPGNVFAAIAADANGASWTAWNYNSRRAVEQMVRQRCEAETRSGTCQVRSILRGCVAIARGINGAWAMHDGMNRNEAGAAAVRACNGLGPPCRLTPQDVVCSGI